MQLIKLTNKFAECCDNFFSMGGGGMNLTRLSEFRCLKYSLEEKKKSQQGCGRWAPQPHHTVISPAGYE